MTWQVLAGSGGEVSLHSTAGIITVTANGVDDFTNYGISVTSAGDGSDVQIRALGTTGDIDDNTNFQVLGYAQGNIRLEVSTVFMHFSNSSTASCAYDRRLT